MRTGWRKQKGAGARGKRRKRERGTEIREVSVSGAVGSKGPSWERSAGICYARQGSSGQRGAMGDVRVREGSRSCEFERDPFDAVEKSLNGCLEAGPSGEAGQAAGTQEELGQGHRPWGQGKLQLRRGSCSQRCSVL